MGGEFPMDVLLMRNVAFVIEYLGRDFCGWQYQKNGTSVQGELERAIESVTGEKVRLTASGRTDAGVNAKGQVANFITDCDISCRKLPLGVNIALPEGISVRKAVDVPIGFNARKDALKKTYIYRFYISSTPSPLRMHTYMQVYKPLAVSDMAEGAAAFVGVHDFKGFMSAGSNEKTTVREIYECRAETFGDEVWITVTGNGFLYNMVRIMAGALLRVGQGRIPADFIPELIDSGERKLAGKTLPPQGLTLEKVYYDVDGLR